MLKLVIESWRKPGMSREDFISHLTDVHAPLVREHGPKLGFKGYVQNHRIPSAEMDAFATNRGWGEAPDSSVEIWIESEESFAAASGSAEAAEASLILEEDEKLFTNAKKISAFLGNEHVIFDYLEPKSTAALQESPVKMVCQVWKRQDFSQSAFEDRWRVGHGDLVRSVAGDMGFRRYVQTHPVASPMVASFAGLRGWRGAPDGLTEVWWENEASLIESLNTSEAAVAGATLQADEVQFVDNTKVTAFLAREHVVF